MTMKLHDAAVGQQVMIQHITDPAVHSMALQFGIAVGETLTVTAKPPGGPMVVQRGQYEVALGRELCRSIDVSALAENSRGKGSR